MKLVLSLAIVLGSASLAAANNYPFLWAFGDEGYSQPRVYSAYDAGGDYRNYYQGYIDATYWGAAQSIGAAYGGYGGFVNPYYYSDPWAGGGYVNPGYPVRYRTGY